MRIIILLAIALLLVTACEESPAGPDIQLPNHPSITIVTDTTDTLEDTVIVEPAPYAVTIETKTLVIQGVFVNIDVQLTAQEARIGGFDFLFSYDQTTLTFQVATTDSSYLYNDCNWEYFTYRVGPFGGCDNDCPSGLVRIVGIAETNNGPIHPASPCIAEGNSLFSLTFLVSNDRTFEGTFVPIKFFWIDCGDNSIASESGDTLFSSRSVHDYDPIRYRYYNLGELYPDSTLPTHIGTTSDCDPAEGSDIFRAIDFYNGGIEIVSPVVIDDRGDLNLDGLAYTIADAVMFSNYFIEDTLALVYIPYANQYGFITGYTGSVAASDVNNDSIPLQVADMVLLIEVVIGDAMLYLNPLPVTDAFLGITDDGVLSIDKEMGAAFMKFAGEITPILLADNMDMKFGFDGVYTRVLVWSIEGLSFYGDFLQVDGNLSSIEMATSEAHLVNIILPPTEILLEQNRPNPFTDKTDIRFGLAEATECRIKIYELVTDKVVATYQATFEAEYTVIRWDASGFKPGQYELELTAGEYVRSIVMTLVN